MGADKTRYQQLTRPKLLLFRCRPNADSFNIASFAIRLLGCLPAKHFSAGRSLASRCIPGAKLLVIYGDALPYQQQVKPLALKHRSSARLI